MIPIPILTNSSLFRQSSNFWTTQSRSWRVPNLEVSSKGLCSMLSRAFDKSKSLYVVFELIRQDEGQRLDVTAQLLDHLNWDSLHDLANLKDSGCRKLRLITLKRKSHSFMNSALSIPRTFSCALDSFLEIASSLFLPHLSALTTLKIYWVTRKQ